MDNYPDLWLSKATPTDNAAAVLLDAYTARVIAEHRDAEQGCCHCGIPGKHYTSDHKAEPPAERERPYWVPFDPNATQA